MDYGRGPIPDGYLPVFSVENEAMAKSLLVAACSLGPDHKYYSRELAASQDIDTLMAFSDKLAKTYELIKAHDAKAKS